MRRLFFPFLTLLCLIAPLSDGFAQISASSADFDTQTITLALTQEPPQLNSMKATDQVSALILGHVMEGLLSYDRRGKMGNQLNWRNFLAT